MKFTASASDDLKGGGNYLSTPGTYHMLIDHMRVGLSSKDEPIDGTTVEMTVLGGDTADQEQKKCSVVLWDLQADKSQEEQAGAVRCLTNFYIATNQLQPNELGSDVEVKPEEAANHQVVMQLSYKQKKVNGEWVDDTKFLRIHFSDVFHVDDPDVANVPKNESALGLIDKKFRHPPEWFAFKEKDKKGGGGSSNGSGKGAKGGDGGGSDYDAW